MPTKQELLSQVEELSRRVEEAEKEALELKASRVLEELGTVRRAESKLKEKLREAEGRLKELEWQLNEATVEPSHTNHKLEEAHEQTELGESEVSRKLCESNYQLEVTNEELIEACEAADWAEWQLEQVRKQFQFDIMKAKETLSAEMQQRHAKDLDARDELIAMLKAKLAEKEGHSETQKQSAVKETRQPLRDSKCAMTQKSDKCPCEPSEKEASALASAGGDSTVSPAPSDVSDGQHVLHKMRLPALPKMNGEDRENSNSFDLWLQKLEKHAELEH